MLYFYVWTFSIQSALHSGIRGKRFKQVNLGKTASKEQRHQQSSPSSNQLEQQRDDGYLCGCPPRCLTYTALLIDKTMAFRQVSTLSIIMT